MTFSVLFNNEFVLVENISLGLLSNYQYNQILIILYSYYKADYF